LIHDTIDDSVSYFSNDSAISSEDFKDSPAKLVAPDHPLNPAIQAALPLADAAMWRHDCSSNKSIHG